MICMKMRLMIIVVRNHDLYHIIIVEPTSMPWKANFQDVSPEEELHFVSHNRALEDDVDVESNAFIVDLKQLCPDLNVVTFQHLLKQYIRARTQKAAKPFLLSMAKELSRSKKKIDKALLLKAEKFRRKHWDKIKAEMALREEQLEEEAKREYRRGRAIFGNFI